MFELDKPYFPLDVPSGAIEVIEGQYILLNMTAIGNPSDITYSWYRGSDRLIPARLRRASINLPRFKQSNGVLNMTGIVRSDAGAYSCEARNAEGSSEQFITINVTCK